MARWLATDDFAREPAEVTRYRALCRAIVGQAIQDLGYRHWDAVYRSAQQFLFEDGDAELVEYRAFLFTVADLDLLRLRRFLAAVDGRKRSRFARSIMPHACGGSGG